MATHPTDAEIRAASSALGGPGKADDRPSLRAFVAILITALVMVLALGAPPAS